MASFFPCERCIGRTQNRQCKRMSCKMSPFCYQHSPIEIRASRFSGDGVFVKSEAKLRKLFKNDQPIQLSNNMKFMGKAYTDKKRFVIADYKPGNELLSTDKLEQRYPGNTLAEYTLGIYNEQEPRQRIGAVNGRKLKTNPKTKSIAATFNMCTHPYSKRRANRGGCRNKVVIEHDLKFAINKRAKLQPDEEIFVHYGDEYKMNK